MQWHGSTNKSPTILNAVKIKFDTGDLFKVTTPKNPLLSITRGYKYKESYQTLWPIPKY